VKKEKQMTVEQSTDASFNPTFRWRSLGTTIERQVRRLQVRIAKAAQLPPRARTLAHRLARLEPYEGKLSSTVLRGGRAGNSPLPLGLSPRPGRRGLAPPIEPSPTKSDQIRPFQSKKTPTPFRPSPHLPSHASHPSQKPMPPPPTYNYEF
jgi:hypothetical protein